jgi:hypothetical protein
MLPKTHFILGALFAAFLFYLFPQVTLFIALIIFLSSFLIDGDHYIFYVLFERDLSLRKAYKWHLMNRIKMRKLSKKERNKHKNEILFFHGIEPIIILFFLSFLWTLLLYVVIGMMFHLCTDIYEEIVQGHRIDKVSVILDTVKYHRLKKLKNS